MSPGIRPSWTKAGDQKRVRAPAEAPAAGADILVAGRATTQANDPAAAAMHVAAELEGAP